MKEGEYEVMSTAEEAHWWYLGLRDLLVRTLSHLAPGRRDDLRVLDAGCGTGANLRLLQEQLRPAYLGGFDASESALRLARAKAPSADIYLSDICAPEVHVDRLDLVTSLDVLYIPGLQRSREGLGLLVDALRPGGHLILNLPAYDWLYSEHDVAVHTTQRFTLRQVGALLEDLGLVRVLLTYRVFWLFPAVILGRLPGMLPRRRAQSRARSDLHRKPPRWMNRVLLETLLRENRRIVAGSRFPWGSSVFAVGRKA